MDKKIDKGCPKKMEIKFYSRVIIFSPFYQVLGFKIRKGAFFGGRPVCSRVQSINNFSTNSF